jgi:hypothetical protein
MLARLQQSPLGFAVGIFNSNDLDRLGAEDGLQN